MSRMLCCLLFVYQLSYASQPAIAQNGLHYVFDASKSMCGYLPGDASTNPLLEQIKLVVNTNRPEEGDRIFLLRQAVKNSDDAARDIVEAPANLHDRAQHVRGGNNCYPFSGAFSNIELIFAPNSPTREADAVLLITDAQIVEGDRNKFVEKFSSWMQESLKNNVHPLAGVALVQAKFSGHYFPISSFKKQKSYLLDMHNRPLLMFWMAKSDKHLARIQDAVSKFAPETLQNSHNAFIQHLLPSLALKLNAFQSKPKFKPSLAELLDKPKFIFTKYDKSRVDSILNGCIRSTVEQDRIILWSNATCQDGKPLFEGVSSISVSFHIKSNSLLLSTAGTSNNVKLENQMKGDVSFTFTNKSFGVKQAFGLNHALNDANNKIPSSEYSLKTDTCPVIAKCTAELAGKTYQLETLFAQLFDRQALATAQLLAPLNNVKYTIELTQRK
ncbi:MAG: hypothetical protein WAW41_10540 [Methylobacter sp.]